MKIKIRFKRGTEKFMYLCNVTDVCLGSDECIYIYKTNGTIITLKAPNVQYIHRTDNNGRDSIWLNSKQS